MSTATERAEARRKAILARRGDRLAKLTSSARGEDAPAYLHDDPPLAPLPKAGNLERFVGEETVLPTPPTASRPVARNSSASPFADFGIPTESTPDPSIWSEEQQARLLNALMAGAQSRSGTQTPQPPSAIEGPNDSNANPNGNFPEGDPFAALMAMMGQQGAGEKDGGPGPLNLGMLQQNMFSPPAPPVSAQRTLLQKVMPVVHLLAGWLLLAYFVIWREPQAYGVKQRAADVSESGWRRWAELGSRSPEDGWGVQFVPFFWAFTTLTLLLHTWRIFKGLDPVRPHMLVSLALPHLPPPIPSVVLNGMKYWQICSVFLDDIAVLLFGIGLIIWFSSWFVN
ncbi:hypothetical protein BDY19DRAFT_91760 [Irpex rosettiformis]|uniref:Uncharacterized protein n=1 Tax=Irpex rosettiformis TaxID=378272 RepID=A0ACB8U689_9APHY|nr:hypothetical protein BDY19DRAFT_91760 [Irpex rosettiformis]